MQVVSKKPYNTKFVTTYRPIESKWCFDLSTLAAPAGAEIYLGDVQIDSKVPFVISSDEVEKSPLYVYVVSDLDMSPEIKFTDAKSSLELLDERVIKVDDKRSYHISNGEIVLMWPF